MNLHETIRLIGDQALTASRKMTRLSTKKKNAILNAMADAIDQQRGLIKEANSRDLALGRSNGLSAAMLDRLTLTDARIGT